MDEPMMVAEFDNRLQAETTANLLQSYGIDCKIWADDLGGMGPGQSFLQGVKVFVDAGDLEWAREILARRA